MPINTVKVQAVAKDGRPRVQIAGSWYTNTTGEPMRTGRIYTVDMDTDRGIIRAILEAGALSKQVTIDVYRRELERVYTILNTAGIDPKRPVGIYILIPDNGEEPDLEPDLILDDDVEYTFEIEEHEQFQDPAYRAELKREREYNAKDKNRVERGKELAADRKEDRMYWERRYGRA